MGQDTNDRDGRGEAVPEVPVALSSAHLPRRDLSVLGSLERYWRGLCEGGALPRRIDVDPACIDGALPHTFVAEIVAPGVARLRVAGRMLNDMNGMDVRGMPLSAMFSADARPTLFEAVVAVCERPALVDMPVRLPRTLLRRAQAGRLLMMPLRDHDGSVNRMLGAIVMDGLALGRGPLKLDIAEQGAIRVEPVGMVMAPPARMRTPSLRLVVNNG